MRAGLPGGGAVGGAACCLGIGWPTGGIGAALLPCQSRGLNSLSLDCDSCCCRDGVELLALPVSLHEKTNAHIHTSKRLKWDPLQFCVFHYLLHKVQPV